MGKNRGNNTRLKETPRKIINGSKEKKKNTSGVLDVFATLRVLNVVKRGCCLNPSWGPKGVPQYNPPVYSSSFLTFEHASSCFRTPAGTAPRPRPKIPCPNKGERRSKKSKMTAGKSHKRECAQVWCDRPFRTSTLMSPRKTICRSDRRRCIEFLI